MTIVLVGMAATAIGFGLLVREDRADPSRPLVWLGTTFMIMGATALLIAVLAFNKGTSR